MLFPGFGNDSQMMLLFGTDFYLLLCKAVVLRLIYNLI